MEKDKSVFGLRGYEYILLYSSSKFSDPLRVNVNLPSCFRKYTHPKCIAACVSKSHLINGQWSLSYIRLSSTILALHVRTQGPFNFVILKVIEVFLIKLVIINDKRKKFCLALHYIRIRIYEKKQKRKS